MNRKPPILESPPGPNARIDGRECLYFVGTSYLGLQGRAEVIRAACDAAEWFGLHSATSRAGFGNNPPVLLAERRAAEFFDLEDAFYFVTGYAGNDILVSAIQQDFDMVLLDEFAHYSVSDAVKRCGLPSLTFRHRDADALRTCLRANLRPGQRPLVLSDGVFSVRGTIAPVAEHLAALGDFAGAGLLLDDAHGVGVLGANGRGTFEHFGLFDAAINAARSSDDDRPARFLVTTMSKAVGGYGGLIPGSRPFLDHAREASHWFAGATAPPAALTAATARAIELVRAEPELRRRLASNVAMLKSGLRAMGFDVDDTPVPIVCLVVGDAANMRRIQGELMRRGVAVAYIASYAGLGPDGGLRLAVFATHTEPMIERLLDELRAVV